MFNLDTEYEKLTREVYEEILKSDGFDTITVQHNVNIVGKSTQKHQIEENTTIFEENETENATALIFKNQTKDLEDNNKSKIENKPVSLLKHATGTELALVILTLIFGFILVGKYYKRD